MLRRALKDSKRKAEAAGIGLEKRSLGGIEWYVQAPEERPALAYREDAPQGTHSGRDEPFGFAPRGTKRRRRYDVDGTPWSTRGDRENDFLGQRGVRFGAQSGKRIVVECVFDGFYDSDDGECPDGARRTYRCVDCDDGTRHAVAAGDARCAIARADEAKEAARLEALQAERRLAREDREALRADAEAAADAADAAIEAEEARGWVFACPCHGGARMVDYDDDEDMVQCASCYAWAHDACVMARLRGAKTADKLSALRQGRYLCAACAPRRYRVTFRCSCAPDVCGFGDDGEAWLECDACGAFCHADCALAAGEDAPCPTCAHAAALPDTPCPAGARVVPTARRFPCFVRADRDFRDETIVREVVGDGAYERPVMGFEVVPGEKWLDVGAHIGTFSSLCLQAGADVVAVEPDADNFRLLVANGTENVLHKPDVHGQFAPLRAAVVADAHAPTATLYTHPKRIAFRHSTERKLVTPAPTWPSVEVPATTLQRLIDDHAVDAVKIDAQGSEVSAVDSVADWRRVSKLVLEYDFEYRPSLPKFHAFVARLRAHFPRIYHSKQKKSGNFSGFPNGVLVFAMRDPPPAL